MQLVHPIPAMEQWLATRVTLRRDLRFDLRRVTSENYVILEDPIRSKFFQIGLQEFKLIACLDGNRTLGEILVKPIDTEQVLSSVFGSSIQPLENAPQSEGFSDEQSIRVVQWLLQNNLGYIALVDHSQRIEEQVKNLTRSKWFGLLNPLTIKIPLFNPNRILDNLGWASTALFSIWFLVAWLVLAGYAGHVLITEWSKVGQASLQIFSGYHWLWMLLAWIGLKVFHEMSHGLACKKFGGEVPEAGVLLILFTPLAYVNVTSMWRLSNRWERIVISAAGIYFELFLSFVALSTWHLTSGFLANIAFNVFIMASVNTILFNANPLMRFDGYFILSDLLQIPNLYPKSIRWLSDRFKQLAFGTSISVGDLNPGERFAIPIYGVLAWCWKLTIGLSLLIAASVLFHGAGIILTALGVVLWYAIPAWKQYQWFLTAKMNNQINQQRLVFSSTIAALLIAATFSVFAAPATKSAPALVQFSGEQILRANSAGFIKDIMVQGGQSVVAGQPLLVLDSPELELETRELEKQIQEAIIQSRIVAKKHELAKAQAETERVESLRQQLAEKMSQRKGLVVLAPADGIVFRRGLENQRGQYVEVGDELLKFARSSTKQVVVTVDQRDWDSIKSSEDKSILVMFPGHKMVSGKLSRIVPKASLHPLHPSLIATNGGPLSVRPTHSRDGETESESEPMELLTPRFKVELELDATLADCLFAGQTGFAFFESKRQSMASYLYLAISDWFSEKMELASQ